MSEIETRVGGCIRCGDCCRKYALNLNLGEPMTELLTAHYGKPQNSIRVRVKHDCQHLRFDENGQSECAIYEERPAICRNFLCQPAQDRASGILIVDVDGNEVAHA